MSPTTGYTIAAALIWTGLATAATAIRAEHRHQLGRAETFHHLYALRRERLRPHLRRT